MPVVKGKKFAYTEKGKKAAKAFATKVKKKSKSFGAMVKGGK